MKLNNKNGYYDEYVCKLAEASDYIVKLGNTLETLGINLYEKDGVTYKSIYQILKEIAQEWEKMSLHPWALTITRRM